MTLAIPDDGRRALTAPTSRPVEAGADADYLPPNPSGDAEFRKALGRKALGICGTDDRPG
jgi:hypothetical protein